MSETTKTQTNTNDQFTTFIKPVHVKNWGLVIDYCWVEIEKANEILNDACKEEDWIKDRFFTSAKFKHFLRGGIVFYV